MLIPFLPKFNYHIVNGNWGAWGNWSICSKTCGFGIQRKSRECNNPLPKYGGDFCKKYAHSPT